jgi:hypothetical protein
MHYNTAEEVRQPSGTNQAEREREKETDTQSDSGDSDDV